MTAPELLACGASAEELLDQVAEGRGEPLDDHQAGCRHCRAALAEYRRLWGPVAELTSTPVRAPAGLFDDVLAGLRAAGPSGRGRVDDADGHWFVAARAVVVVAGHAARTTDGVRVALGALQDRLAGSLPGVAEVVAGPRVEAGIVGQSVALELTVAADYGQDLHGLAERLRRRVTDEVRAVTGLEAVDIAVTIDDVLPPRPQVPDDDPG